MIAQAYSLRVEGKYQNIQLKEAKVSCCWRGENEWETALFPCKLGFYNMYIYSFMIKIKDKTSEIKNMNY